MNPVNGASGGEDVGPGLGYSKTVEHQREEDSHFSAMAMLFQEDATTAVIARAVAPELEFKI